MLRRPPSLGALAGDTLRRRLRERPHVLDGAGAGELLRRGVHAAGYLWGVGALLENPEEVRRLHADYARAGADVLTALTFRVAPYALRQEGLEGRGAELAERAVHLAREGAAEAGREALVLASMTTLEDCYRPERRPPEEVLRREHAATAQVLAAANPDGLLLETFNSLAEAVAAVEAASHTGLPVLVSFACGPGGRLLSGEAVEVAATAVCLPEVAAVGVNCTAVAHLAEALRALRQTLMLPLLAYANNAFYTDETPHLWAEPLEPGSYAQHAVAWVRAGARLVGGCCGTTPAHIAAVAQALAQEDQSAQHRGQRPGDPGGTMGGDGPATPL